jgi:hypothetical protein
MKDLGYHLPARSLPLRFYRLHHFHAAMVRPGRESLPVELHWDTQPYFSLSKIPEDDFWRSARPLQIGGATVRVPGREESFLHLLQHLSRHTLGLRREILADPVAFLLDRSIQGRLVWLTDLGLLARSEPGLDWDRVERQAERWGLATDLAVARRLLARLGGGSWPRAERTENGARYGGEGATATRAAAGWFPGLARTSHVLQMRPVQVFEAVRYAFPGAGWIRNHYGLREAWAGRVVLRAGVHALQVSCKLGWMVGGALTGSLLRARSAGRSNALNNETDTQMVKGFTRPGNC